MSHLIHPDDSSQVSAQYPLSTDDMSTSSSVASITGETVSLYYSNSGTRTIDAGQAAGVAVHGVLANRPVLDASGGKVATFNDKSLSFTGDCFTTEVRFPVDRAERLKNDTWANKLAGITSGFASGTYCIDYKSGDVYGVKATTTSSLTSAAYKINQAKTDTSVTLSTGDVEIGAVEIKNATDDTRATVGANGLYVDVRAMPAGGLTTYSAQTTIGHGVKTVTTAGTDEALAASTACKRVIIQAQTDN
ncbi:MAG: hypothetical protein CO099_10175, partial [Bdellovibrio sp. CG_4_9_14_3_um_filter_39_7]